MKLVYLLSGHIKEEEEEETTNALIRPQQHYLLPDSS